MGAPCTCGGSNGPVSTSQDTTVGGNLGWAVNLRLGDPCKRKDGNLAKLWSFLGPKKKKKRREARRKDGRSDGHFWSTITAKNSDKSAKRAASAWRKMQQAPFVLQNEGEPRKIRCGKLPSDAGGWENARQNAVWKGWVHPLSSCVSLEEGNNYVSLPPTPALGPSRPAPLPEDSERHPIALPHRAAASGLTVALRTTAVVPPPPPRAKRPPPGTGRGGPAGVEGAARLAGGEPSAARSLGAYWLRQVEATPPPSFPLVACVRRAPPCPPPLRGHLSLWGK